MSTNDRNEAFFDKNDAAADNEAFAGSTEGELSQDELDNVSGGLARAKAAQPDGLMSWGKTDVPPSGDPSELRS